MICAVITVQIALGSRKVLKSIVSRILAMAATSAFFMQSSVTLAAAVPAPPAELSEIPVGLLVDLGSGQVLVAKDADRPFLPASVTKVMTAFVAFEEISSKKLKLDRNFVVPDDISRDWFAKGTTMYLKGGDVVSTDDLLHGIMTASANDASMVLGHGYAGSVPRWTAMMNDAARRLGMTHSHYNTPNGWMDQGQTYVSANDLVKLSDAMITRYPGLYHHFVGVKRYRWRDVYMVSHDPTVGVIPGADGIKTGYTREAGYNFLGTAERNGRRLVMVLAGSKTHQIRDAAARSLLEWGFSSWHTRPLFAKTEIVSRAMVQDGDIRSVPLVADRNVYATIPNEGEQPVRLEVRYKGPIIAPIAKGAHIADLEIRVGSLNAGTVPLFAASEVKLAGPVDRIFNGIMNLLS